LHAMRAQIKAPALVANSESSLKESAKSLDPKSTPTSTAFASEGRVEPDLDCVDPRSLETLDFVNATSRYDLFRSDVGLEIDRPCRHYR
jgi:hypothetical protein